MKIMKLENFNLAIPIHILEICQKIEEHGEEAYLVGGCVRDILLDKEPNDWDFATTANPEKIVKIFGSTFGNGIKYGIPFVRYKGETYEIAQLRTDLNCDGRHCETEATRDVKEDVKRRDLTINACAYRPTTNELFYPETAMEDLKAKRLKTVGSAEERFLEDYLRILRVYRFASTLNMTIDEETRNSAISIIKRDGLKFVSNERINKEFTKLICGENAKVVLDMMREDGILELIIPELKITFDYDQENPHHDKNLFEHIISSVNYVEQEPIIRWCALLHDIGKPSCATLDENKNKHFKGHAIASAHIAETILTRLRFSKKEKNDIVTLIQYHDFLCAETSLNIRPSILRLVNKIGIELVKKVFDFRYADILAQSSFEQENKLKRIDFYKEICMEIEKDLKRPSLKSLAINGNDLICIGFKKGPLLGETLNELLEIVIERPNLNKKEILLGFAAIILEKRN